MNIKLNLYIDTYSMQKALLWGNFIDHCKKIKTTTGWNRTFHFLIAIAEAAPIISQIVSIFENIIVKKINPKGLIPNTKNKPSSQTQTQKNENPLHLKNLLNKNTSLVIQTTSLNKKELRLINDYYIENLTELEKQKEPLHIRKDEKNQLPRSLVYVPNGPRSGMYILLKTKNKVKEIGHGGMCRVTRAFHLDSGTLKAFRSARKKDISNTEVKANKLLNNKLKFFATGVAVTYQGTWRKRGYKKDKVSVHQEKNIEKTAFIMDLFEGGDLFDYKYKKKLEKQPRECVRLGKKIAKTIDALHKENLVHHDLKPENIILTEDNEPKLADFAFTVKSGINIPLWGTKEYLAPELWNKGQLQSNPAVDIWGLGCILAFLKRSRKENKEWWNTEKISKEDFKNSKNIHLKDRKNPKSLDYIIDQCLLWNPKKRPSSKKVLKMFKQVNLSDGREKTRSFKTEMNRAPPKKQLTRVKSIRNTRLSFRGRLLLDIFSNDFQWRAAAGSSEITR